MRGTPALELLEDELGLEDSSEVLIGAVEPVLIPDKIPRFDGHGTQMKSENPMVAKRKHII